SWWSRATAWRSSPTRPARSRVWWTSTRSTTRCAGCGTVGTDGSAPRKPTASPPGPTRKRQPSHDHHPGTGAANDAQPGEAVHAPAAAAFSGQLPVHARGTRRRTGRPVLLGEQPGTDARRAPEDE